MFIYLLKSKVSFRVFEYSFYKGRAQTFVFHDLCKGFRVSI
ncbi:hypothetical protein VDG1235_2699 [Verrucomicrobiia bacterium DG1235]|nr:hypothetical protein VDG1235_2699 [Verrucomicrobiae bacterium DG1235]